MSPTGYKPVTKKIRMIRVYVFKALASKKIMSLFRLAARVIKHQDILWR